MTLASPPSPAGPEPASIPAPEQPRLFKADPIGLAAPEKLASKTRRFFKSASKAKPKARPKPLTESERFRIAEIWKRYGDWMLSTARRMLPRNPELAEELVSQVMFDLCRGTIRGVVNDSELKPYLLVMLENRRVRNRAKQSRTENGQLRMWALLQSSPSNPVLEAIDRREIAGMLSACCGRLPAHHRRAAELVYVQGITRVDAARGEGIGPSAMRKREHRMLNRLREIISPSLDPGGTPLAGLTARLDHLVRSGLRPWQIAARFGWHYQTTADRLRREGLHPRPETESPTGDHHAQTE